MKYINDSYIVSSYVHKDKHLLTAEWIRTMLASIQFKTKFASASLNVKIKI